MNNLISDLLQVNRQQRHDFLNHLQVIWGFLKLNKKEEVIDYIKSVTDYYKGLRVVNNIVSPQLAANFTSKLIEIGFNDNLILDIPDIWDVEEDKISQFEGLFDEIWKILVDKIHMMELKVKISLLEEKIIIYVHNVEDKHKKILETIKLLVAKYKFNYSVKDEHIIIYLS